MATVSDLMKLNTLVLQLALKQIPQTPSQVIEGANAGVLEYVSEVSDRFGVGQGWLSPVNVDVRATLDEIMARWGNAADAHDYGAEWDDERSGWIVLSWAIGEMIRSDAGEVTVR